jgi:ABC-type multidrug transport system fused ATPase/permease subunit
VITDRTETLPLGQCIVLLDAGRVVSIGTHAQLAATQPLFRRLFDERGPIRALPEVA